MDIDSKTKICITPKHRKISLETNLEFPEPFNIPSEGIEDIACIRLLSCKLKWDRGYRTDITRNNDIDNSEKAGEYVSERDMIEGHFKEVTKYIQLYLDYKRKNCIKKQSEH